MKITNWAENVYFTPNEVAYPRSETEIQNTVLKAANAHKKIRVIGSGHSFTPLIHTQDILVSLDKYQGIVNVDKEKMQVTVKAGTKLELLGDLLFQQGLAMENLGDIDVQSIAGAISTGTHGTGITFGSISAQVVALKFVNGKGELVSCSLTDQTKLFKAAQLSLGALGIITEITLRCVPAYKLLVQNRKEDLSEVIMTINDRNLINRNFEHFWIPHTNTTWTKSSITVDHGEPDKEGFWHYVSDVLLENYAFKALCEFARIFPSQNKNVARIIAYNVPTIKKLNYSHKVYSTVRLVKFREMEYSIPAQAYQEVIREVVKVANSGKYPIHFPIENRWVKGDDIMLNPAHGRDSAYIACHTYANKDGKGYFNALEEIFRAYDGRPHWGKLHTLKADTFAQIYPYFNEFNAIRKEQDPDGTFTTSYLKEILG